MRSFSYHRATSINEAATLLADPNAAPLGGGTDLLVCIEEGIASPHTLVDLRTVPGVRGIALVPDGSLRIGATTRLHEIARDGVVRERWPALARACDAVGTPALRHM